MYNQMIDDAFNDSKLFDMGGISSSAAISNNFNGIDYLKSKFGVLLYNTKIKLLL